MSSFLFKLFARVTGFHTPFNVFTKLQHMHKRKNNSESSWSDEFLIHSFFFLVVKKLIAYCYRRVLSITRILTARILWLSTSVCIINCNIKMNWKANNIKLFNAWPGKESDSKIIIIAKTIVIFKFHTNKKVRWI